MDLPRSAARSRNPRISYQESLVRWSTREAAEDYPSEYGNSLRDRRELRCIRQFVESLPYKARVLDIPCGTGRLTPLLQSRGLSVVGADCSPWMVQTARERCSGRRSGRSSGLEAVFEVREALATGYGDQTFDAVICNRLFHHFREPDTRTAVFRELGRICRGPMLVSFFNSFAVDAMRVRLRHWLRGKTATDRIPIPLARIQSEIRAAGLETLATRAVLWGLSPMWYVIVRNRATPAARAA